MQNILDPVFNGILALIEGQIQEVRLMSAAQMKVKIRNVDKFSFPGRISGRRVGN
jgi:hypothetical protein